MATFDGRLKELRKRNGITQVEVCNACGIGLRNYKTYEAGEVQPAAAVIVKLSQFFDCTTDYLLGQEISLENEPVDEFSEIKKTTVSTEDRPKWQQDLLDLVSDFSPEEALEASKFVDYLISKRKK